MVGVHGDDVLRALGDNARKHADVAADVPRQVPVARAGDLAHEVALLRRVRRLVVAALQIVGPGRLLRLPLQAGDERAQTLGVRLDDPLVEPGLAQILAHVARRRVVGLLRLGLKIDVREHAAAQVVARAQQFRQTSASMPSMLPRIHG